VVEDQPISSPETKGDSRLHTERMILMVMTLVDAHVPQPTVLGYPRTTPAITTGREGGHLRHYDSGRRSVSAMGRFPSRRVG
jgi:hypothetical protein